MSIKGSLAERTLNAAKWGYLGAVGKLLIQLASQILLARILGPADYGMFAVGAIVISVASFFADASIGSALIQREKINDELIGFIFTWQLMAGALVTFTIFLLSSRIAEFLMHPEASQVLRFLSFVCIISAATSVPSNLLRRDLNFKTLQVGQVAGFAVGYLLVGIPLALNGAGVWSLIVAWLVQASCTLVFLWNAARPPLKLRLWTKNGGDTLKFGGHALLSNVATWLGSNLDRIIVSRAYSAHELGVYHVVNNLVSTAITQIISTLQSVTFSSNSKISSDQDRIKTSFLITAEAGPVIVLPIFSALAVVAKIVLIGLYGKKWQEGIQLLQPVALVAAMYGLSGTITPLLWASKNIGHESRVQIFSSALIAFSCYFAATVGSTVTVAWTLFGVASLRYVYVLQFAAKTFGVALKTLCKHLAPGMMTTLFSCIGAWVVSIALKPFAESNPIFILIATIIACAVLWLLSAITAIQLTASDALKATIKDLIFKRGITAPTESKA